jgi:hypothetical protein
MAPYYSPLNFGSRLIFMLLSIPLGFIRQLLFALFILALSACSHHQIARDGWPEAIPPNSYFLSVYKADSANKLIQTEEEYFTWIIRFYNGWELYRRGWTKMTNELLEQVEDPTQTKEIKFKIDRLGRLVSGEWAKKVKNRCIFTRHVAIWGNALLESLDRGEPLPLINQINQDVDDLLAHKIHPDLITAARYFPPDEDDPFF